MNNQLLKIATHLRKAGWNYLRIEWFQLGEVWRVTIERRPNTPNRWGESYMGVGVAAPSLLEALHELETSANEAIFRQATKAPRGV